MITFEDFKKEVKVKNINEYNNELFTLIYKYNELIFDEISFGNKDIDEAYNIFYNLIKWEQKKGKTIMINYNDYKNKIKITERENEDDILLDEYSIKTFIVLSSDKHEVAFDKEYYNEETFEDGCRYLYMADNKLSIKEFNRITQQGE